MKLYFFRDPEGNFGDDLNPWLFNHLFPNLFDEDDAELLVGVGTLLNHRIPTARRVVVFGSGHGYGDLPRITKDWTFYCVRGPGTARALKLDPGLAITDPAMLAPLFFHTNIEKISKTSYMPHCVSARLGDWQHICQLAGINFIDPRRPFLEVFTQINQTGHLITEAMHGAILADAFRVPWTPARAYPHISEFKWQDWLDSVDVRTSFSNLESVYRGDELFGLRDKFKNKIKRSLASASIWRDEWQRAPPVRSSQRVAELCARQLQQLASQQSGWLSADSRLQKNTERLLEKAACLRKDHGH